MCGLLCFQKSRIRETKHLSTDEDSSTDTKKMLWKIYHLSPITCHLSGVKCHMSCVTCHMSPVTCHHKNTTATDPHLCNTSTMHSRVDQEYQKPNIFEKRKKSSKMQKLKHVYRYAKISDIPFDKRSLIHREAWFPPCFVRHNQQKKQNFLYHFQTKMFKYETTSFYYFTPRIPNL